MTPSSISVIFTTISAASRTSVLSFYRARSKEAVAIRWGYTIKSTLLSSNHSCRFGRCSSSGTPPSDSKPVDNSTSSSTASLFANYLPSIKSLASRLPPNLRRQPTPSDLLPLAHSSLDRLQIRLKWLTIRSFRAYRTDDYSAFASLFVLLNLILAGIFTTTFIGVFLCLFNKAGMEDLVARWLSDRLSQAIGVQIVFGSAVVPKWTDGMIRFEKVWVSRGSRPSTDGRIGQLVQLIHSSSHLTTASDRNRERLNLSHLQPDHHLSNLDQQQLDYEIDLQENPSSSSITKGQEGETKQTHTTPSTSQLTHFHLTIASIDVTLSLRRWLNGKGLIRLAELRGIRGVIDRSHLSYESLDTQQGSVDRRMFRKMPSAGDFHLEGLLIDDLLLTVFQPNRFRPYTFSIFNATFNRVRRQWLFFDLLSAEQMTGQVDNCLFSLHKPQWISTSDLNSVVGYSNLSTRSKDENYRKRYLTRLSRFRIDGVPIDHLRANSTDSVGPLGWINSGKVDIIADIRLPFEVEQIDLKSVVREIVDNFEKEIVNQRMASKGADGGRITERPELLKPALEPPAPTQLSDASQIESDSEDEPEMDEKVIIDLDIRFKDVKASVPIFRNNLSYVNNALVRPIVAFINANRTLIPIKCQVKIDLEEFNGSWTSFDIGLIESISEEVYQALAYHVGSDEKAHSNRISHVRRWGIQLTANAILNALRHHWDSAH